MKNNIMIYSAIHQIGDTIFMIDLKTKNWNFPQSLWGESIIKYTQKVIQEVVVRFLYTNARK
jgi:hypothetical protein